MREFKKDNWLFIRATCHYKSCDKGKNGKKNVFEKPKMNFKKEQLLGKAPMFCSVGCYAAHRVSMTPVVVLKCTNPACKNTKTMKACVLAGKKKHRKQKNFFCSSACYTTHFTINHTKLVTCCNSDCKHGINATPKQFRVSTSKNSNSKTKVFYCSKGCLNAARNKKKSLGLCQVQGCNHMASILTSQRLCPTHYADTKASAISWSKKAKAEADHRCQLIAEATGLHSHSLFASEKSTRECLRTIFKQAGLLDMQLLADNERNVRWNNYDRMGLDLDVVLDQLFLVIEWKSHSMNWGKAEFYGQRKKQKRFLKRSPLAKYEYVCASIDGTLGKYNFKTLLEFLKARVNRMYNAKQLKTFNIKRANTTFDFYISLLSNCVFEVCHMR